VSAFALSFEDPATSSADPASTFFWTLDDRSTIDARLVSAGRIGPRLGRLGPVPEPNIDLVRIAVAVFAADRSVPREGAGSNWNRRSIELTVPVLDPATWTAAHDQLKTVIDLLSGDDWSVTFVDGTTDEDPAQIEGSPQRVVLLSGGADSAVGALRSRCELTADQSHTLVSHYANNILPHLQTTIADQAQALIPGPAQAHVKAKLTRVTHNAAGGWFADEPTQRSRSLLFLAMGLAVASVHGVEVWIPENGFASLNPPLGPERLGSVSTRTTHPTFLAGLSAVMSTVGGHGTIVNPFAWMTKGEMFRWAADQVGDDEASSFLSSTHSCAHNDHRHLGLSTNSSCGVCFGCVVRRASFLAAGLDDRTDYVDPGNANDAAKAQHWLDGKSIESSMRRFVRRGIGSRDLIAMGLPEDYSMAATADLCRRGLDELQSLVG
jgi:hypothetical protein